MQHYQVYRMAFLSFLLGGCAGVLAAAFLAPPEWRRLAGARRRPARPRDVSAAEKAEPSKAKAGAPSPSELP